MILALLYGENRPATYTIGLCDKIAGGEGALLSTRQLKQNTRQRKGSCIMQCASFDAVELAPSFPSLPNIICICIVVAVEAAHDALRVRGAWNA